MNSITRRPLTLARLPRVARGAGGRVSDVIFARLRALVRRGTHERPPVLTVGDLTLDPASHRVKRRDRDVELTATEYSLLEYLMRHPDEVMTKADILANVWDWESDATANLVEVYIGYLRRKIDDPFGTPLIETVRGAGYRLTDPGAKDEAS